MVTHCARLIGIVPTYNEGPLAATAIRSLLDAVDNVVVFEGPVGEAPDEGEPTLLPFKSGKVIVKRGAWDNEAAKRNAMLDYTRRFPAPTWAIYLDADEVMMGAEYVRDVIWATTTHAPEGQEPTALPVSITEIDGSVGRIHRIIRVDMLERHVLSMSQLQFRGQSLVATFPVIPLWRPGEAVRVEDNVYKGPPLLGTPSIHHRAYLRPPRRAEYRLHAEEITEFNDELRRLGIRAEVPGSMPVQQDPGLIVARETEGRQRPCDNCGFPPSKHLRDETGALVCPL